MFWSGPLARFPALRTRSSAAYAAVAAKVLAYQAFVKSAIVRVDSVVDLAIVPNQRPLERTKHRPTTDLLRSMSAVQIVMMVTKCVIRSSDNVWIGECIGAVPFRLAMPD